MWQTANMEVRRFNILWDNLPQVITFYKHKGRSDDCYGDDNNSKTILNLIELSILNMVLFVKMFFNLFSLFFKCYILDNFYYFQVLRKTSNSGVQTFCPILKKQVIKPRRLPVTVPVNQSRLAKPVATVRKILTEIIFKMMRY